jgi:anti-anti-sigma factor
MLVTAVKELIRTGERDIVLDLGRVRMITSTGLGMLMRARNRMEREEGTLHLCELTPRSQELLYIRCMKREMRPSRQYTWRIEPFETLTPAKSVRGDEAFERHPGIFPPP